MLEEARAICAISTAYGEGGIGIVRVSGEDAGRILSAVFVPKNGTKTGGRVLRYGNAVDREGNVIDEVLAVYMKGPGTYTGEDVAEIQCHGGVLSTRKILDACHDAGARYAEPGEFTKLAFLNGRLDLAEAESVIDLIEAGSERAYKEALSKLKGSLSKEITEIRELLTDQLVLLAVNIDYPDEDIEVATLEKLRTALKPVRARIERLAKSTEEGKLYREGLSCAIVGKPNVGKSSLLNAFLREERAIVTDIPGTTRDTIEESVAIDGIRVTFTDTAGMRETSDPIEKIGVERSKNAVSLADLVLFVLDSNRKIDAEDIELAKQLDPKKTLVILNKADAETVTSLANVREAFPGLPVPMLLSAKTGEGLEEIRKEIVSSVLSGKVSPGSGLVITSLRQKESVEKALHLLDDALSAIERGDALDIVEVDVRASWEALGEIIGETATEDIVDRVFERFCLGK